MIFRSKPLSSLPGYRRNRSLLVIAGLVATAVILAQLLFLTVFRSSEYQERAQRNLLTNFRLESPRGNFFDRHGTVLATNRRSYSVTYSPWGQSDEEGRELLGRIDLLLGNLDSERIEEILATRPRWTRHGIARRVSQEALLPLLERPQAFPGVRISTDFSREYHSPLAFAHVIGYLGRIQPAEVERYVRPRYLPDDHVGRGSLERTLEDDLAGFPGRERQRRDARQRLLDEPEILENAIPGKDVWLTLDRRWQERAMELLEGQQGTIVVLDVRSGELAVIASRPTYDPRNVGLASVGGQEASFFNRAVRGGFPPGSTFKIVGAALALAEGFGHEHSIHCQGHFQPAGWNRTFWCNVRSGHGPADLTDSLKWSCNVYYYEMSQLVEPEKWLAMARAFGFGEPTGSDLPGESGGRLPHLAASQAGERVNFSIGQGGLTSTPLQVANAYAALANGGRLTIPHVVRHIGHTPPGDTAPRLRPGRLPLTASQIGRINNGLHKVVNEPGGTAWRAGIPAEWGVVGKTGTAENARGGTDAWMAGFFPHDAPRYSFVVHLEEIDQHGGEAAAPVARDLIRTVLGLDRDEGEDGPDLAGEP